MSAPPPVRPATTGVPPREPASSARPARTGPVNDSTRRPPGPADPMRADDGRGRERPYDLLAHDPLSALQDQQERLVPVGTPRIWVKFL